jgi:hypothetical protein
MADEYDINSWYRYELYGDLSADDRGDWSEI